jgi:hypothetical protein
MAKPDKKPKYTGHRSLFDTAGQREVEQKRREKNEKNKLTSLSNDAFALDNPEFKKACEDAGVKPTARQASKYRQPAPYGAAARTAGKNTRKDPRV